MKGKIGAGNKVDGRSTGLRKDRKTNERRLPLGEGGEFGEAQSFEPALQLDLKWTEWTEVDLVD